MSPPEPAPARGRAYAVTRTLFVLPSLVVVVALLIYPVLSSIYFSLTDRHLLRADWAMVGFDNFVEVLTSPEYWHAFGVSVRWTALSIAGQLLVGFLAALALQRIPRFTGVFRTLLIIPWAFPAIVIAFGWRWILNDVYGFLPNLLTKLGLTDHNVGFLADPGAVFWTVLAINVWFGAPLFMVNILAALETVPREHREAAVVDGANALQRFWYIVLPNISKVIGLLVILRTIWVFNNFELVFLLTGGGPAGLTTTLPIYAYRTGWGLQQLGVASAVTVLLLVFLLAVAALAFRLVGRRDRLEAS